VERIPLAIVGCGGMGGRHLRGLKELHDSGLGNIELTAVCDLRADNAGYLADLAEAMFGRRPRVYTDLEAMAQDIPDLQAPRSTCPSLSGPIGTKAAAFTSTILKPMNPTGCLVQPVPNYRPAIRALFCPIPSLRPAGGTAPWRPKKSARFAPAA